MSAVVATSDRSYLGREFLTWLWFLSEAEGGELTVPSGKLELIVEDEIMLVGHDDDEAATRVKGGCPSLRAEAASALASGMTVRRARFVAAREDRDWTFNLDAETLDLRSVKVPTPDAEDPLEQLTERLEAAEELRSMVEELYATFLELRLSPDWDLREAERMRDWIRVKLDRVRADQDRFAADDAPPPQPIIRAPKEEELVPLDDAFAMEECDE